MPQLGLPVLKRPGDVIASAEQEQVLLDLETITSSISANNIKQGALTTQHFDWSADPVVQSHADMWSNGTGMTLSSTTMTAITDGITPMEVTGLNTTLTNGMVLEVHLSFRFVGPDASAAPGDDLYRFQIVCEQTSPSATPVIASRIVHSMLGSDGSRTSYLPLDEVWNARHSYEFYNIWTDGNFVLNNVYVQGLVSNAGNTIFIDDWSLSVRCVKF